MMSFEDLLYYISIFGDACLCDLLENVKKKSFMVKVRMVITFTGVGRVHNNFLQVLAL